jgi:hypothetical protein
LYSLGCFTGENKNSANAQSLNTPLGKILRIDKDGSIPTDNPFFDQTTGERERIRRRRVRAASLDSWAVWTGKGSNMVCNFAVGQ